MNAFLHIVHNAFRKGVSLLACNVDQFAVDIHFFSSCQPLAELIIKAVANAPVSVTGDMNIKVPVKLKLQLRRHIDILIFTSIHLVYLMIWFLCGELEKIIVSDFFFSNLTVIYFLPVLQP